MQRKTFLRGMAASLAALVASGRLAAAGYPDKPVRIVVGFAPGGATDAMARLFAQRLGILYDKPVIVENREGAGTNIAVDAVARAPADGHTLLMGGISNAINASLYSKLPFNFPADFVPVLVLKGSNVLVVNPSVPAKSVREFVELAKARAGRLSFASSGAGSSIHMSGELFKMVAGVDMLHVPYRGSAPALNALVAGQVDAMFDSVQSAEPFIRSGKLRAIAVTTPRRSANLPDVPTFQEAGMSGYVVEPWQATFVRSTTSAALVEKISADLYAIASSAELHPRLEASGFAPVQMPPAQMAEFLAQEARRWAAVVKATGAKAD